LVGGLEWGGKAQAGEARSYHLSSIIAPRVRTPHVT